MEDNVQPTPKIHRHIEPKIWIFVLIVAANLVVGGYYLYLYTLNRNSSLNNLAQNSNKEALSKQTAVAKSSLGGELFNQLSNPILNQLPQTLTLIPNVLEGFYKNPFK